MTRPSVISPSTRLRASPSTLLGASGHAVIEYAVFIIIILTALYFMKGPILHAFYGRWKATGDSFAFGRQYDPKGTTACTHDTNSDVWYDERCFDNQRGPCDQMTDDSAAAACEQGIMSGCIMDCPQNP